MSGKGPGIFSDIAKKARDILTKYYNSDQRLTISPIEVNETLLKSSFSFGDVAVAVAVKHKNKSFVEVFAGYSLTGAVPSMRNIGSIHLPDYFSGKIEVQYLLDHAGFTAAVDYDLYRNPVIDFSATVGGPNVAFGAEISYSTSVGELTNYNAGYCYNLPSSITSVILADKGDTLKVSYLQEVEKLNGGAVVGELSRKFSTDESTLTVGCSYLVDPQTVVKAKLNNHGDLGALVRHELTQKSFLTISGAFETKDLFKIPKFGFSLLLKP